MLPRHPRPWPTFLLALGLLAAAPPVWAEPLARVGILQGSAVLVRQATRFALAEGAPLEDGDIVQTPAGAFLQIEFGDGAIVNLAQAGRLILKPRVSGPKGFGAPRLYILEGWLKIRLPPRGHAGFDVMSPQLALETKAGAVVARIQPDAFAVFSESSETRLVQRSTAGSVTLKPGDFASFAPSADTPPVSVRPTPAFVQDMPRPFRDPLPARAPLFAGRTITLQSLGPIDYAEVKPWLHSEPGVRLALSRQWRGRAADRAFRAELVANLSAHMEWERVLYPERFLPKKPPAPQTAAPASEPTRRLLN